MRNTRGLLVQFELPSAWSTESVDICWLDCSEPGFLLQVLPGDPGGFDIVLCAAHAREMESSSQSGYSQADPPRPPSTSEWWPWLRGCPERWEGREPYAAA